MQPIHQTSRTTLYLGDALEVLESLPTNSVDLVITSPPYEDARTYGIDFTTKGEAWVAWAVERFIECCRVSRGLVAWVVEGRTRQFRWSATPALMMADLHRAGIRLRKPPAFHRVGVPGSGGPDWFRNDYEFIVCASDGRLPWSDNTAMGKPPKWAPGGEMSYRLSDGTRRNQWGGSGKSNARRRNGERQQNGSRPSHNYRTPREAANDLAYNPPVVANPGNVISLKVGGGLMGSKLAHENEAPFPEGLAEFFIRSCCPPSGVVLDPFIGSGTTAAVAIKTGRKAVGIEIRESQIELTKRRLKEVQTELGVLCD